MVGTNTSVAYTRKTDKFCNLINITAESMHDFTDCSTWVFTFRQDFTQSPLHLPPSLYNTPRYVVTKFHLSLIQPFVISLDLILNISGIRQGL